MCKSDAQQSRTAADGTLRLAELWVTFVLQVLGGCGAVWGFSEALSVRCGANNDNWRVLSLAAGVCCLARWLLLQFRADARLDGVLARFLLQVCGGVGAIWGAAEILGFRINYPSDCHAARRGATGTFSQHRLTEEFEGIAGAWAPGYATCANTYVFWHGACGLVFLAFLCRWNGLVPQGRAFRFIDLHVATFVLDVLGGGGAVWGCAEVFGVGGHSLRLGWGDHHFGQPSFDLWRLVCAPVFAACFALWAKDWHKREAATPDLVETPTAAELELGLPGAAAKASALELELPTMLTSMQTMPSSGKPRVTEPSLPHDQVLSVRSLSSWIP